MAFDGIVTRAAVHELASLVTGRITKVYQPTDTEIVMQIRARNGNTRLLLSASHSFPRLHITKKEYQNPLEPPMFCMLLRKYCEGAIIESITQAGMERIIHIDIKSRDELGDDRRKRLVLEIMGRHSNLILLDPETGLIHDGLHHVTPAISQHRVVLPGRPYVAPPPQDKINPLTADYNDFIRLIDLNQGKISRQIVASFAGISPLVADEIVYRAGLSTREALWKAFNTIMGPVKNNKYVPNIQFGDKTAFSVIQLTQFTSGTNEVFGTVSECLEAFYHGKAQRDAVKQKLHDLIRFVSNERNKNAKKIEKLKLTLEEAEDAKRFQQFGELITANIYQLERGQTEANVLNYYKEDAPIVSIPLDPALTPSENAQAYFKKYTKAKNSVAIVGDQIEHARKEIAYFDTILQQIEGAGLQDIEEIREELIEQGYIRARHAKNNRKAKPKAPVIAQYTSSEGIPIYVGKNNRQNDYLTSKVAGSEDTWLHTKDIPGSHVVIKSASYGEATLHEAAQLAAYFSKGRESSQVPVDYTLVRHVKKPKGAKPGFVIYEQQKTLFVTPDESVIRNLADK
ncbi:NFACT RNA binding domain-containing protein [Aneurinibacillus sp. Ricciae_BoGa-3]|uniref:Rqc2 family fibronectin-binding protein n=1 Tax=Aneurinibacillus sp. Ricciae_BoGa-3 TaxID=3022697 RepID=UPI0023408C96|nr:NFACT RNA binding domain-containing protein [Aneurinibacillus sp. Ricciae_BoGa-3]WCK53046.1 NFACT RNA binding domain-containing protein [Aneurinibacillus sp. Ricciae_BoGa-3]